MHKMCDLYFEISVGPKFWPTDMHETLMCAVVFPFIRHPPWELRGTPKVLRLVREVCSVLQKDPMATGNLLLKFVQFSRRLSSMPHDVVWRMLHFLPKDQVSCAQVRGLEASGEKRKGYSKVRGEVGKKRAKTSGLLGG